ncbi:hypothetical protein [[Phormidium] sp. ETS-05]|uniref:hypothetical protein n=1 Tax=[Phormidium] sp. ETS-05 TaxID=222819 RepID=UPI0018EEF93C|nr:hypothetical protein [[Phormidium] sp. ETS-05]
MECSGQHYCDRIETNGGDINLTAGDNISILRFLNSRGGNMNITSNLLQVNDTFTNSNGIDASISSASGSSGGSITIRHNGRTTTPLLWVMLPHWGRRELLPAATKPLTRSLPSPFPEYIQPGEYYY